MINNKVDVVIAAKTIPKNTPITEDNVGEYFAHHSSTRDFLKPPRSKSNTNELIGQYAL